MCGLFGFVGGKLNLDALREIALATEAARGGDAFGFAWVDSKGRLRSFKMPGALAARPHALDLAWDARMLMGHSRWATNGDARSNINNHPFPCDGGWLAHNGTLPMHRQLASYWGVSPSSFCDSEVLAGLVEVAPDGPLPRRLAWAVSVGRQAMPQAALGLWPRPARLLAAVAGKPLHWTRQAGGTYLSSEGIHLPGRATAFGDNRVYAIGEDGDVIEQAKIGPNASGGRQGVGGGKGPVAKGGAGSRRGKRQSAASDGAGLFPGD